MKTNLILLFVLLFTPVLSNAQKTKTNPPKKEKLPTTMIVCDGDSIPEGYSIIAQTLKLECVQKNQTGKAFTISTSGNSNANSSESVNTASKSVKQQEDAAAKAQEQKARIEFADNLSFCTKHKMNFTHPFTRDILEQEVLGEIDGKCNYVQHMPAGGKMECKFSESERKEAAQYFKTFHNAKSYSARISFGMNGSQSKEIIDGKEVENPIGKAMNSGVCVISGYGSREKVELIFFYRKDSSEEERESFYKRVLKEQDKGGYYWLRGEVRSVLSTNKNGYEGFEITFNPKATKGQREDIKNQISRSPLIYKVYENVMLDEIKDL